MKETDKLVYGAGAKRDAGGVLGIGLPKLNPQQALVVQRAKKYAMEVERPVTLKTLVKYCEFVYSGEHQDGAYEADPGTPAATN